MFKLVLPSSHIDEYLKYHHRTFIQQLMKTEAEISSGAPKVHLKSERSENMRKDVKTIMVTLTEKVYLS